MALSPQTIRDTSFKSVRKGYDPAEVESFVEEVAAALESAQNEATAMEARARAAVARLQELSQQTGEAATASASAEVHAKVEEVETISRTLLLAQRTADQTVADAQAEADRLLASARDDAAGTLDAARAEAAQIIDQAKAEARRAGEAERVQVEGEVQALLARRDFLESDVDHLEQYLLAQRERIIEAVASLNDLVQRVPAGLGDMRRPLLSAAAEGPHGTDDAGDEGGAAVAAADDPVALPSDAGPADAGADDDLTAAPEGRDEIAEITRVASADQADEAGPDVTPADGTLFDDGGHPTEQLTTVEPRQSGTA